MGPNIQKVSHESQSTPFAEDFIKALQGQLSIAQGTPAGPQQRNSVGTTGRQTQNALFQNLGGVNTAGSVQDFTPQLIEAITGRSQIQTDRNAAQTRESFSALGNRFSGGAAKAEGQTRNEGQLNLDQLVASVLQGQGDRMQAARQFDVQANLESLMPFLQIAGMGILPEEIIATPGIGQQLFTGALDMMGAYLGGGGSFGRGGGGNPMKIGGGSSGGNQWMLPTLPGRNT